MAPLKIAVLSHTHPSVTRGGAEISAYTLYVGLRELGHEAHFVAACPAQDQSKLMLQSENEHIVLYDTRDYDGFYHIAPPAVVAQVEDIMRRTGAEIVIFHHILFFGVNAIRALTSSGVRVALTLHEYLVLCHHHGQMVTKPARRLCNRSHPVACAQCFPALEPSQFAARRHFLLDSLGDVAAFISPSRFLINRFVDWGFPQQRFHFIENGLMALAAGATIPTRPLAPLPPVGGAVAPAVIGFFGQMNPFKGIDVILDALDRLRETPGARPVQIRVHGAIVSLTDDMQARLDAAITARAIDYVGPYDNGDVWRLMEQCDFVLMASRWWENSPVVIQEAFAANRPLIVPGIGGMAEKVADGVTGFHFKVGDSFDLARVIREAIDLDCSSFQFPAALAPRDMAAQYLEAVIGPADIVETARPPPRKRAAGRLSEAGL